MDEEDERLMRLKRESDKAYVRGMYMKGDVELRLYEREELENEYRREYRWYNSSKRILKSPEEGQRQEYAQRGIPYSFIRFCDSLTGFYKGSLDLSGRHEQRFLSLFHRYEIFLGQFVNLLEQIVPTLAQQGDGQITETTTQNRTSSDEARTAEVELRAGRAISELKRRWNLGIGEIEIVFIYLRELNQCMSPNYQPILQQICFTHLPPELLHLVVQNSDLRCARELGATCKLLRQIALPHISKKHYISLTMPPKMLKTICSDIPREEISPYVHQEAQKNRANLIDNASNLRTNPHIATWIRDLTSRGWPSTLFSRTGWDDDEITQFQTSISLELQGVFNIAVNVRRLNLSHLSIDGGLAKAILSMPNISYLVLEQCKTTFSALALSHPPSRLQHLSILPAAPQDELSDAWALWELLPFLRNLRWLNIRHDDLTSPPKLPPTAITALFNPFSVLERVDISNLGLAQHERLVSMLEEASESTNHLRMTHMKLSFEGNMPRSVLWGIVTALEGFPLEALVFRNVKGVDPALLEHIARKLPNLRALTIIRRKKKNRDMYSRKAFRKVWPRPSWEYARALRRFNCLEYFGWNFDSQADGFVWSPCYMLYFEEAACAASIADEDPGEYEEEMKLMATLFTTFRPTLKYVMFLDDNGFKCKYLDCSGISHGGEVTAHSAEPPGPGLSYELYDSKYTWPYFDKSLPMLE